MTPTVFYNNVIVPSVQLLPVKYDNWQSRMLLFVIAGQESGWTHRMQEPVPFAHGFWQCEHEIVVDLLNHPTFGAALRKMCALHEVAPADPSTIHNAIVYHDALAYAVARLILLADPKPLPKIGDIEGSWTYYERNWRPGKPRQSAWEGVYNAALTVCPVKS